MTRTHGRADEVTLTFNRALITFHHALFLLHVTSRKLHLNFKTCRWINKTCSCNEFKHQELHSSEYLQPYEVVSYKPLKDDSGGFKQSPERQSVSPSLETL